MAQNKYYAVTLRMLDEEKSATYRAEHLEFLKDLSDRGIVAAYGRYVDGAGGLIIYKGETLEDIELLVKEDPYVQKGARLYEIHEWAVVFVEGNN